MAEQTSRLAVIIDSSGAQKNADSLTTSLSKLTQAGEKAETATENLSSATKDYNSWMKKGPKLADEYTKSTQAATKATNDEAKALGALLDKINPINAALNRLDDQQQALSKFKSKGMLDEETFTEYNAKLEQAREKLTGFSEALTKTGDTSRHAAHNIAMIPSQLSWMVTSIASGESPIMALIQQGSMLSGMMGGLGPTIKAVGAYLTGLINPFTVAAAAVGVLGLAYYQGEQEQEAFKKSLILTGNQVGKTADQLSDMAASISTATGTTQGQAASVIAQVVSTGTIAGDSLQKVSAAIVSMSDATGQATDSLVADFNNIANDPVAAITKLNDQYHFLTLATYNQVKALQDEGDQQDAARVASDAYATALSSRAADINKNLGTIESGWKAITTATEGAIDAMLAVGREQTLQQKLDTEKNGLGVGQWSIYNPQSAYGGGNTSEINILQSAVNLQNDLSGAISSANASTQRQITLQQQADKDGEQFATAAERRAKAINLENTYLKAGVITLEQYSSRVSRIDQMYKDPVAPKQHQGRAYTEDAGSRLIDQLNQQHTVLVSQLNTTGQLSTAQQLLVKWEQKLADLKTKSTLTADQKSLLANQDKITTLYQQNAAIEKQEQLLKQASQLSGYQSNLNKDVSTRQFQYSTTEQAASGSISAYQQGILTQRVTLEQQLNEKIIQLRQQRTSATTSIDRDTIDKEITMQQAANDEMLKDYDNHTQKMESMRSSWSNGAEKAWAEYADSAENISGMTQTLFSDAFTGMEDSLVKFVTSGKLSFKSFADSVVSDLARIAARMAISGLANTAISGVSSLFSSGATAASASGAASSIGAFGLSTSYTGYDSGGFTGVGGKYVPAGIVHKGEFVFTQEATNRIGKDNLARLMKGYSSGGYVGSPALSSVDGTSKSSGNSISLGGIVVNVNSQGQASSDSSTGGQSIARQIQAAVVNTINEQANKQGTPLWRAIKGR